MSSPSTDPPDAAPELDAAKPASEEAAPVDVPPEPEPVPEGEAVETMLRRYLSLPPVRITSRPPPAEPVDREASTVPPSKGKKTKVEEVDSKLAEVEPLLKATNWGAVVELLSKQESLPPPLALLYAVALRERDEKGDPDGIAIRAAAALLCVPEESETALVVAKRILRRNPVGWQKRPAPSARVSVAIIILVLALGALAGFLAGPGGFVLR